jgi:predicted XRE-type DNA-binding protein
MRKKVETDGTTSHSTKPASGQVAGYVEVGTGDVFTDLGFRDAGERKLRVQLAMRINELLQERKLTQAKAAVLFGIPQPHISELKHYKLSRFSSERLMHFLTLLDKDVEIIIRPKAKGHESGLLSVLVAA